MWSWIFKEDSLFSFLAFCFALNTMYSFDRIRNRLLGRLQNGLREIVEENKSAIKDCEATLRKSHDSIKNTAKKCFDIKDYYSEIDNLNQRYERRFEVISNVFKWTFGIFALISSVLLVFSQCPCLLVYYKFTVFLLTPCVVFPFVSLFYHVKIGFVVKRKRKEIAADDKKIIAYKELLDTMNNLMVSSKE